MVCTQLSFIAVVVVVANNSNNNLPDATIRIQ